MAASPIPASPNAGEMRPGRPPLKAVNLVLLFDFPPEIWYNT
jgi:hypothetical protein